VAKFLIVNIVAGRRIILAPQRLLAALGASNDFDLGGSPPVPTCAASEVRRGHRVRLVIPSPAPKPAWQA